MTLLDMLLLLARRGALLCPMCGGPYAIRDLPLHQVLSHRRA